MTRNHGNHGDRQSERDVREAIEQCHKYFQGLNLDRAAGAEPDPTIQDKEGLVSYVAAGANDPPKQLTEEYRQISAILEGLTGIVTAAVLELAGSDTKKKHLAETWNDPLANIVQAFFGPYKDANQSLNKQVIGVEVATEFLEILLSAAVAGGPAFLGFKNFLESQGKSIRIEAGSSVAGYDYACIGMAHELFELQPGEWLYVPKLKYYFTAFTQENAKISAACASVEKYTFAFQMRELSAAFKLEYWRQNKWFRDEVDNFISTYTRANIAKSTNYFNGIFKSKPSSSALLDLRLTSLENRALHASASL